MNDIVIWLIIWILIMLIIVVSVNPTTPTPINYDINHNVLNIPIVGVQKFKQPHWANRLLLGDKIDFGCYDLSVVQNGILINNQLIKVKPNLTNVSPYMVEFDFKVKLSRGSPFIETSILPNNLDRWYVKNGYIWLKLNLPDWYGNINPLLVNEKILIDDHSINVSWNENVYYWIPKYLLHGWQGEVLYHLDDKVLVYGKSWQYNYIRQYYNKVLNSNLPLFNPDLKYNASNGSIQPIDRVIELVKQTFEIGIPTNQAANERVKLLTTSLLNYKRNQYFTILPMIDLYLMKTNSELDISQALSILGYIIHYK